MKISITFFLYLLLFFVISCSCSKFSNIFFKEKHFILKDQNIELSHINKITWYVGPLRRQHLSKGFSVLLTFPALKKEHIEKIKRKYKIDSWLIKVSKKGFSSTSHLETIYVPLSSRENSSKFNYDSRKKGVIRIYYAAAAPSRRLGNLSCPAFKHRKKLKAIEIKEKRGKKEITLKSVSSGKFMFREAKQFEIGGNIINGEHHLEGEYIFEIALYNVKEKKQMSEFVEYPHFVKVFREEEREIKGCVKASSLEKRQE